MRMIRWPRGRLKTRSDSQLGAETMREEDDRSKAATDLLNAETKAVADIRVGSPAPYYFASSAPTAPAQPATSPRSTKEEGAGKKSPRSSKSKGRQESNPLGQRKR